MEAEMNLKILFLKTQHAAWRHVRWTNTALSWVQNVLHIKLVVKKSLFTSSSPRY